MSFLDKIKNKGKNEGKADVDIDDTGPSTENAAAADESQDFQPSIITTAQPTAEFQETGAGFQPTTAAVEAASSMPRNCRRSRRAAPAC